MASTANQAAEELFARIKSEIFDFRLLPGDRFTETEIALRYGVSRTPVRSALYRLKHEGYLEVQFRGGWMVRPFDFDRFNELYDLRTVLEAAAVEQLCRAETKPELEDLKTTWLVPAMRRETDARRMAEMDEIFHCRLVAAAGNREVARVHESVTEQIRVIRRLDFLKEKRIATTYEEHAKILKMVFNRQKTEALMLLKAHIAQSKTEVRKITVHMLHMARESAQFADPAPKQHIKSSA